MLEKLNAGSSYDTPLHDTDPTSLVRRMRAAMEGEGRRPDFGDMVPEIQPIQEKPGTKPEPVPVKELIDMMCREWFKNDFLKAMLMGDPDEKLGMKAEPYAD